jgi:IS5 family transposase
MHHIRKGEQWFFGMKLHIGVDAGTGPAHSAVVTAANVHDKHPLPDPLRGREKQVWGDCAYANQQALISAAAPAAQDLTNRLVRKGSVTEELERMVNRAKSRVRVRVEHVFVVVKRLWGFDKVRYRGLAKNATRAFVASALANLFLARKRLAA